MSLAGVRLIVDFIARLAFFAITPFLVVFLAFLFPVTGAVVQIALALIVFLTSETTRRLTVRWPVLRSVFANEMKLEAFYRDRPPRPFIYYLCYPLLFPYWLWVKEARREFLLYKGYTLFSFGFLLLSLAVQYQRYFPPELSFRDFLPLAAGSFAVETVVVLVFLMPFVTTVVHFHRLHAPRRLVLLLLAALVSVSFATYRLERRRDPIVSFATRVRVRLRSDAAPANAHTAQLHALQAAWLALADNAHDTDRDGRVDGVPLSVAREKLGELYKYDEAHAFDLWYSKQILVLYFEAHRGREPMWVALDERGTPITESAQLPDGAFRAMRHASR